MKYTDQGAHFSDDMKFRFCLWRIWDEAKPLVMFIGLNPSTANATTDDPTIRSIVRIAQSNGYGGVYMLNCFPIVSTYPKMVTTEGMYENNEVLFKICLQCKDIVFAWGNFSIVEKHTRRQYLEGLFPDALALGINKNGSPKHPLYCATNTKLVRFIQNTQLDATNLQP